MDLNINIPEPFRFLFTPSRYKAAYGGRGSAKSWSFAEILILLAVQKKLRILCTREIQKSINDSVKRLLDDTITRLGLNDYFESTQTELRCKNGSLFLFAGLRHNINNIKSMEGIDICWIEEGNTISRDSWEKLKPTIRKEGSEIWITFNPEHEDDPVYEDLVLNTPENAIVKKVNFYDNPFFPDVLREEMEYDKQCDPDKYSHIWEGNIKKISDAIVFNGKYKIDVFDPPAGTEFIYGADWGFAQDPTCLLRGWIDEDRRRIYWDYEAYGLKTEIEDIPKLFDTVPESRKWNIIGDSARPETISHMNRKGFRVSPSIKGAGSIEDGVEFLRSYDMIVHERCKHLRYELSAYSYKINSTTGEILPILVDANNHFIDCARYATEKYRRAKKKRKTRVTII